MKTAMLAAVLLSAVAAAQVPEPARPLEQHRWLQQLVGEWNVTMAASMGPGTEPMQMESTESCRAVGQTWVVGEGKANLGGTMFTSMMTLGYDPAKQAFVGTWIDTMQTHLWVYRGTLDDAGKVLTLEAEGPRHDDPTRPAKYRDAIEIVGPDHKRLTSSMLGDDGKWVTFMTADYRRKPAQDKSPGKK